MRVHRRHFMELLGMSVAGSAMLSRAQSPIPVPAPPVTGPVGDNDRPEYHLLAPHNWMNDPNGPIFWKGKFHMFYQLNPNAAIWGDMHWGHAVSTDMIRWHHEAIALAPTPGGADSEGCFSGSAVVYNGVPTILYTGVQNAAPDKATIRDGQNKLRETQMIATADGDDIAHWVKTETPVIADPPADMQVTGFRDPCPWKEEDGWYLALGSGERGNGGCVLLYRSQDLRHWTYVGKLAQGMPGDSPTATDPVGSGDMWECPDFFEVNGTHCLYYSAKGKVISMTGDYDKAAHRFTQRHSGLLDHGSYYAAKSFVAPDGRRIVWGWIQESRPQAEFAAAGWSGVMSLPRQLRASADGQLIIEPAKEVELLRGTVVRSPLASGTPHRRTSETLRHEFAFNVKKHPASLEFRLQTGGAVRWRITLDYATGKVRCGSAEFALPAPVLGAADLRIFLDGSVIECFVGGREAVTSRVYGLIPGATTLVSEVKGPGSVELSHWPLNAISKDRLTS